MDQLSTTHELDIFMFFSVNSYLDPLPTSDMFLSFLFPLLG